MELSKQSSDIEPLLNKVITKLSSLDELYEKADNKDKREIIGSIYPKKLTFDRFHYRTARLNESVELIYNLGEGLAKMKMDKPNQISICPLWCPEQDSNLHILANAAT